MNALLIILGLVFAIPVFLVLGLMIYVYVQRRVELATVKAENYGQSDPLLDAIDPQGVGLLYFTSDSCAPCKMVQRPALDELETIHPNLPIITVNIQQQTEIAQRWRVMSVPRTIVIGKGRQIHAVNMDVTLADQLHQQIDAAQAESSGKKVVTKAETGFKLSRITINPV